MNELVSVQVNAPEQNSWDIQLNCCGYYKGITNDIPNSRPTGRADYHIIFVQRGQLRVQIHGQSCAVNKDEIVYFPPGVAQYYRYRAGADTSYYWVHFAGTKAAALLQEFPLQHRVYPLKHLQEYTGRLEQIGELAQSAQPGSAYLCHAKTQQLLIRLLQSLFPEKADREQTRSAQIAAAIRSDPVSAPGAQELAQQYGVSPYHLIHTFTREMGCSPGKYRSKMLAQKAQQLLLDTRLSVAQLAELLGFSDPLYFSRWFKKETGVSPSDFRRK